MKRKNVKKLRLNVETLNRMNLEAVSGAATLLPCEERTRDYTNCPMCGQTNYITCLNC